MKSKISPRRRRCLAWAGRRWTRTRRCRTWRCSLVVAMMIQVKNPPNQETRGNGDTYGVSVARSYLSSPKGIRWPPPPPAAEAEDDDDDDSASAAKRSSHRLSSSSATLHEALTLPWPGRLNSNVPPGCCCCCWWRSSSPRRRRTTTTATAAAAARAGGRGAAAPWPRRAAGRAIHYCSHSFLNLLCCLLQNQSQQCLQICNPWLPLYIERDGDIYSCFDFAIYLLISFLLKI